MHSPTGCDFCNYFLSTYNAGVGPPACHGSCTFAVIGKCAGLLKKSVTDTLG
jgi:hypothetical protein